MPIDDDPPDENATPDAQGETREPAQPPFDRRKMYRYRGRAQARILRDDDRMRTGVASELLDISPTGLGIKTRCELKLGEQVKLVLTNEIQRIECETRGIVRHLTQLEDGACHVGLELFTRLTPMQVSQLRMGISSETDSGDARWV